MLYFIFFFFARYSLFNVALFFFFFVYCHMFRNIYYYAYTFPKWEVWIIGLIILLLMILTAFLGYVLPWGQMSLWAATVITNLFGSIPIVGGHIVVWLWGGFSVDNPTVTKFYSLHYFLPVVIFLLVVVHVFFLHVSGSLNPIGLAASEDKIPFGPYFVLKDLLSILLFFGALIFVVCFYPNVLGHPDNYIKGDPLVTPDHIVPEWYFLPFYAILRSFPDKTVGICALILCIALLFTFPFFVSKGNKSKVGIKIHDIGFYTFCVVCVLLGWLGFQEVESPFLELGQVLTAFYVFYLTVWVGFANLSRNLRLVWRSTVKTTKWFYKLFF